MLLFNLMLWVGLLEISSSYALSLLVNLNARSQSGGCVYTGPELSAIGFRPSNQNEPPNGLTTFMRSLEAFGHGGTDGPADSHVNNDTTQIEVQVSKSESDSFVHETSGIGGHDEVSLASVDSIKGTSRHFVVRSLMKGESCY
jgi:hypothetical protein